MIRFLLTAGFVALAALPVRADGYWAGEGYVVPKDGVTLRVRSIQLVARIFHDIGDKVKKGDLLLQFDDKSAKVDLLVAQLNLRKKELEMKLALAKMEVGKAHLTRSQVDVDRLRKIGPSRDELAKVESDFAAAKAEVAAAEIQIELAKIEIETAKAFVMGEEVKVDELTLKAPFDGTVIARYTTVGEWISKPDQSLIDMVGTTFMIEAAVPSHLLPLLKDKTPIEIALDRDGGERTFKSQVTLVGPVIDPRTKTVKIQFAIPEAEQKLIRPGMTVAVKVGTKKGED